MIWSSLLFRLDTILKINEKSIPPSNMKDDFNIVFPLYISANDL